MKDFIILIHDKKTSVDFYWCGFLSGIIPNYSTLIKDAKHFKTNTLARRDLIKLKEQQDKYIIELKSS
jgi:hypothetical protein